MEPQQFRLRAVYSKTGRLVMLSHLEVAESLRRCVRRAALPFAVSQGFSPHMKMTFSSALPVGVGSTCEIFDLMLTEYVPPEQAFSALVEASVPDLMVTQARYVEKKAPAASVAFPVGYYRACFDGPADQLNLPEQIVVQRAKKAPKTLAVADYLRGEAACEGSNLTFALEALKTGSLRPDYLLREALSAYNARFADASGASGSQFDTSGAQKLHLASCTRVDQRDAAGRSILEA